MLVNLYLKEGNVINNCNLYPEDVKNGELPYASRDQIEISLSKVPWGNKFISFQTENIHGKIHVNNIERFEYVGTITLSVNSRVKIVKNTSDHGFSVGEFVEFTGTIDEDDDTVFVFRNKEGLEQGLFIQDFEVIK